MELELVAVVGLFQRVPLIHDEHLAVATGRDAGVLARLGDLRLVLELDLRRVALEIARRSRFRLSPYGDACLSALTTRQPGIRRAGELAVLVLLWILAEVPDVAVPVLGDKGQLLLDERTVLEVAVPDHGAADAIDRFGDVGHREDHPMGPRALTPVGRPVVDEL